MTEMQWLSSDDPHAMAVWLTRSSLPSLRSVPPSRRKLRLFLAAALPAVAPESELVPRVLAMADDPAIPHDPRWWPTDKDAADSARFATTAILSPESKARLAVILRDIIGNPFKGRVTTAPISDTWAREGWRFDPSWVTPDALQMAQAAYEGRDWTALPVIADALEEAGAGTIACSCSECAASHPLTHLRSPGPHVRGCWALDLVLGKS